MTEFDPGIAYRILAEKQRRLYEEAHRHLRNRFIAQMEGHWYDEVFCEHDGLHSACVKEADDMRDVLDYLSARITFGRWGEIGRRRND